MKNPSTERAAAIAQAQGWADQLHLLADYIGHHFPRSEPRQRVRAYLKGLLSPVERKNGWQLAEQAGDTSPVIHRDDLVIKAIEAGLPFLD